MRTHIFILFCLTSFLSVCSGKGENLIDTTNVESIEFKPAFGKGNFFTNTSDVVLIATWINDTLKAPISYFDVKSYPLPIHPIIVKYKSGKLETFLISGGNPVLSDRDEKNPKLLKKLTLLSVQGKNRQYLAKTRPEALFALPPLKQ